MQQLPCILGCRIYDSVSSSRPNHDSDLRAAGRDGAARLRVRPASGQAQGSLLSQISVRLAPNPHKQERLVTALLDLGLFPSKALTGEVKTRQGIF